MSLADVLHTLARDPAGGYSSDIPDSWRQGRTLYGGLTTALAAAAARAHGTELGPLRSLQIAFIAPPLGRPRYEPSILHSGRSVTFLGVDCATDAGLCSRAVLTYGRARTSDMHDRRLAAPPVPPASHCPVVRIDAAQAPAFLAHVELRFAAGSPPFSGGEPEFAMWVRHRDATGVDPELALIAVADVLPPAVLAARSDFRPASSITWMIDLADVPADPTDWYLLTSSSDIAADGYSLQSMCCFAADGRLAAAGRQTVAVF